MNICCVPLARHIDPRGELIVAAPPFKVERAFWILDVPFRTSRGCHAHKVQHQFIVAIAGGCHFKAREVGAPADSSNGVLWTPSIGLYAPPMTYVELFQFSPDARILVLASGQYDEKDYIR